MSDGISSELSDEELHAGLGQGVEAFGAEAKYSIPDCPDTPWRLLAEEDGVLTFGLGQWDENGPVDNADHFSVQRDGAGWTIAPPEGTGPGRDRRIGRRLLDLDSAGGPPGLPGQPHGLAQDHVVGAAR